MSSELGQPDYDPGRDPNRNKLLPKWYGPFPVEERIGENAYRVALPHRYLARGRHATFNVDQLKYSLDVPEIFRGREIAIIPATKPWTNFGPKKVTLPFTKPITIVRYKG